jgi:mannose-1-phosphate guanylyltransferase / mannose-6-phosphate isomerase
MRDEIYGVILAGGSGTRLWPLSRNLLPKQFLKVGKKGSFFEQTVKRIAPIVGKKNILAVTNKLHAFGAGYNQFKDLRILIEPEAKNTAPAIGLSAIYLKKLAKTDPIIIVLPSDHMIARSADFQKVIKKAIAEAKKGRIVTLGIVPESPETGYGYIEVAKKPSSFNRVALPVKRFMEKPDLKTATKFVKTERFFWNSGMFVFKASVILEEFKKYTPALHDKLWEIYNEAFAANKIDYDKLNQSFSLMPNISIDYAIMEKSKLVYTIPSKIGWSDVGSWHYFHKVLNKDKNKNVKFGDVIDVDSSNNLLYSDKRLVATIGVNNLSIIETADAVLVSDINRSQEVKKVVEKLKKRKRNECHEHLTVARPWGYYTVLVDLPGHRVKKVKFSPYQKINFRYHKSSLRHWFIVKGKAEVVLGTKKIIVRENCHIDIPKNVEYKIRNLGGKDLELIEIQTGKDFASGDIVNLDDRHHRI